MITLAVESVSRPIFPWEAVSGVAAKARVWYELGSLAPFMPPVAILQGLGNYTDADPRALSLPSLLLVWTANAIGFSLEHGYRLLRKTTRLKTPPLLSRQAVHVLGRNQDFSNRKARELLGWEPRVGYAAGLEATLVWLRAEHLKN